MNRSLPISHLISYTPHQAKLQCVDKIEGLLIDIKETTTRAFVKTCIENLEICIDVADVKCFGGD